MGFQAGEVEGAMVDLDPVLVLWVAPETIWIRADLGASSAYDSETDPDLDDLVIAPPGWGVIDFDDGAERAWLGLAIDAGTARSALGPLCRQLAEHARDLLPRMAALSYDFDKPMTYEERLATGPF
jgi:hypothetical protein